MCDKCKNCNCNCLNRCSLLQWLYQQCCVAKKTTTVEVLSSPPTTQSPAPTPISAPAPTPTLISTSTSTSAPAPSKTSKALGEAKVHGISKTVQLTTLKDIQSSVRQKRLEGNDARKNFVFLSDLIENSENRSPTPTAATATAATSKVDYRYLLKTPT